MAQTTVAMLARNGTENVLVFSEKEKVREKEKESAEQERETMEKVKNEKLLRRDVPQKHMVSRRRAWWIRVEYGPDIHSARKRRRVRMTKRHS